MEVVREQLRELPSGPAVVATGPLTSGALTEAIGKELGDDGLAFYDAIAPIVHSDSVDRSVAFAAGRYGQAADYLNCPLDASEYNAFVRALQAADRYEGHDWEEIPYFEGCLPIEEMAERGHDTPRFGPMRPTGLRDPRTGRRPHAVVQLRREDRRGYLREANPDDFQPMNSNWGLVDPMPDTPRRKLDRRRALAARADASFRRWAAGVGVAPSGDRCLAAATTSE